MLANLCILWGLELGAGIFHDFSLIKFGWVERAAAAEGFGPSAGGATHPKRRCDR